MKEMAFDSLLATPARAIAACHGFGYAQTIDLNFDRREPRARAAGIRQGSPSGRLANTGTILQEAENRLKTLLVAGLGGDQIAYRGFLQALALHVRGYLRRRIPQHREDVEDLVQEILLAVHNARHTYRVDEPLTAWLHAIARYKLMDFFRSRARRESLNDPLDDHAEFLAVADDEPAQARHDISKLLEDLPDKQRLPIVHMKLQGLSVTETARITGLSESAVKVGVHRGLKALAARMRGLK
jgi:RNA polymerase sigma-70 factor (ECF subfamily)